MPEPEPIIGSGDEKEDEDLDGVPLDGAALLKSAYMRGIPGAVAAIDSPSMDKSVRLHDNRAADSDYEDDIDGVPCKSPTSHRFLNDEI